MSDRPLDVLETSLGDEVTVRLKDGEVFDGVLGGYDQHMNLVIERPARVDPDEDEAATPESEGEVTIIRGDNLVSITT